MGPAIKTAWDTFTGAIGTVWDNTLGLLFGEAGLIDQGHRVRADQVGRDMGPGQDCVGHVHGCIQTVWDTTLALLFGEEGLIAKAIGFVQTKWDEIWGLVKTAWDTFTGAIRRCGTPHSPCCLVRRA